MAKAASFKFAASQANKDFTTSAVYCHILLTLSPKSPSYSAICRQCAYLVSIMAAKQISSYVT